MRCDPAASKAAYWWGKTALIFAGAFHALVLALCGVVGVKLLGFQSTNVPLSSPAEQCIREEKELKTAGTPFAYKSAVYSAQHNSAGQTCRNWDIWLFILAVVVALALALLSVLLSVLVLVLLPPTSSLAFCMTPSISSRHKVAIASLFLSWMNPQMYVYFRNGRFRPEEADGEPGCSRTEENGNRNCGRNRASCAASPSDTAAQESLAGGNKIRVPLPADGKPGFYAFSLRDWRACQQTHDRNEGVYHTILVSGKQESQSSAGTVVADGCLQPVYTVSGTFGCDTVGPHLAMVLKSIVVWSMTQIS